MTSVQTTCGEPSAARPGARQAFAALLAAESPARGRRVLLLIGFLWMVNLFDLTFTILAHQLGGFRELNPIAAGILHHADILTAFKVCAVLGATLIFAVYRRRLFTELACWLLAGVYTALSFIWLAYYAALG